MFYKKLINNSAENQYLVFNHSYHNCGQKQDINCRLTAVQSKKNLSSKFLIIFYD